MTQESTLLTQALAALTRHGFGVQHFTTAEAALAWLSAQVPDGGVAGFGGSVTLRQIGLPDLLRQRPVTVLDHWQLEPGGDKDALFRASADADAYFCSANAITADGYILNVDGNGNRLSMHTYGPKHLYLVAGLNKLVPDVPAAFARIPEIAPRNCVRAGHKTPCVVTGRCMDCDGAPRSCRAYLLLRSPSRAVPATVVFIDKELGL